jgi:hypothetical protein
MVQASLRGKSMDNYTIMESDVKEAELIIRL